MAEENKDCMPRLRFPEFLRNDGKFVRLESVARYINDKIHIDNVNVDNYISTENMLQNYKGICQAANLPSVSSITVYQPNDILISNIRPYLKKIWLSDRKGGASNDIIVLRPHKVNPKYLYQYLTTDRFISYLMKGVKGTKMPRGDIGEIKKYLIYYIDGREQQKITHCLSSIDELIQAHEQKLDALVEHKKGLMQRLFPTEGETTPRWRFPEFRKARKWETAPLNKLVKTITPPKKILTDNYEKSGKVPIIDQSKERISGYTNDVEATVSIGCPVIIFGDHTCIIKYVDFNFAQGADGIKILLPLNIIPRFLYEYLYFFPVIPTGYSRHFSILKEKNIYFPSDVKEQQKIADCLSSLDARIEAEEAKITALREHKQGLMQRLFPQSL